ncbi:MAG TPA: ATP-binding protein [Metabacillus sp.]|nr:ATP-binding protein [Metabacillus sp.]
MNTSIYMVFSNMMIDNELEQIKAETEKMAIDVSKGIKQVNPKDLLLAYVPVDGMIQVLSADGNPVTTITSNSETALNKKNGEYDTGEKSEIITYENKQYAFSSIPIIWSDGNIVNLQVTKSMDTTNEILSVLKIVLVVVTIIESYADLVKRRRKQRPEVIDESIEAIHSEAVRMRDMIEQLLLLAKHDEKWNIEMKEINITELVKESSIIFQNAYGRTIELEFNDMVYATTDAQKLKQLLFIFLDNAKKYSDEKISIYIGKNEGQPCIRITDRGIGIPRSDLTKVFDRFYRVDKARTRKKGGSGLGLSMAKEIAEAIGIEIQLESVEGAGTTVTLFL